MPIQIKLNGEEHSLDDAMDIHSLIKSLEMSPGSVVVEHNREILHRDKYKQAFLKDGDTVELIRFVGGG